MEASKRLKCIAELIEDCEVIADIGTDHGYLPIYLVEKGSCTRAIASDINYGPIEKAKLNILLEGMNDKICCRLGGGLSTIKPYEVNCAIIAGMGGNLIRDILEAGMDVFKTLDYAILQPVQNPEVLRKYIYDRGFQIIDEELCEDENKFYEIIKVKYSEDLSISKNVNYEISNLLIEKKHPLVKKYICLKLKKYDKILYSIANKGVLAEKRKVIINKNIEELEEMLKCL